VAKIKPAKPGTAAENAKKQPVTSERRRTKRIALNNNESRQTKGLQSNANESRQTRGLQSNHNSSLSRR
jgi:hypothetical protein